MPGGAADQEGSVTTGDEIIGVDGEMVLGSSHRHVVELMAGASAQGRVTLTLRRRTFTPTGEHNMYCLALQKSSFIVLLSFSVFPTFTVLLCSITVQADVIFLYLVENSFCYCSVAHLFLYMLKDFIHYF